MSNKRVYDKDTCILVMSCDNYSDTWSTFIKLKNKYWKDCPYDIYFGTETRAVPFIKTIQKQGIWTKRVRETLAELPYKNVIFLLDDFFIRSNVDQKRIEYAINQLDDITAVFNFEKVYNDTIDAGLDGFNLRKNNEMYMCSCQPSVWNKQILQELLQKDMDCWTWETQTLTSNYNFYINTKDLIIDIGYYDRKPFSIKQGKWCREIVEFFEQENINIDYSIRGFFDEYVAKPKNEPLLSIIMPYYKTLDLTKTLLNELKSQCSGKSVEIIVIDDGCDEKELDSFDVKVIHKVNGGVSSARNTGLDNANGKFIAFIDSDDMVAPNYIDKILEKIQKEVFDYCFMSWSSTGRLGGNFIIYDFTPKWNTCVWNCIYKRELIGNNRFNESKQIAEDEDFNLKVRFGVKANILDVLYYYNSGRDGSLTTRYSNKEIGAERSDDIKTQILVYQKAVSVIGGIETWLYEFFKQMHDKYDIVFMYKDADLVQLKRYKELVRCIRFNGQHIECNTYLGSSAYDNIAENVNATSGRYIQMIHADLIGIAKIFKYYKHPKTTLHVAVSDVAKNSFKKLFPNYEIITIHNLLQVDKPKKVLNLISATRLSWEKGYDRMKQLAKRLNERNIPFSWQVFTNDLPDEQIDGFIFRKTRLDVQNYIANADYLIQFSDTESWGNTVAESLELGTPVVVTDYPAQAEQGVIDGVNGFVIDMQMGLLDETIDKMYNNNLKGFKYDKKDNIQDWIDLFGIMQKQDVYIYQPDPLEDYVKIRAIRNYTDMQRNENITIGQEYLVLPERGQQIVTAGLAIMV